MNDQISSNEINTAGHLQIGGVDTLQLANKYGTPLLVYDVAKIRNQIQRFRNVFEHAGVRYEVSYASKAFSSVAIYQVMKQEHAHIDVVSGGELATAIKAGFPLTQVSFHGNNKSRAELKMALDDGVGTIVVDNFHEIELLRALLQERSQTVDVQLRITPGIAAHTNSYIATGQVDSKFGFDVESGQADRALQQLLSISKVHVTGIHAHIGSQIFDVQGFKGVAKKLVQIAAQWKQKYGFSAEVLNVGGGFGIKYSNEDHPINPEDFVQAIVQMVKKSIHEQNLAMPAIWIEPGRSIVGPAGYTLYTIGSRKDIPGLRSYVSVDGGMGDNIRPALYNAKYESVLARDPQASAVETVKIAGKYCESGDILSNEQELPETKPGDVLVMLDTGAYDYAMASNYNRNPRPAVVFVENGHDQLVIKRETYDDLTHLDLNYESE
ncbi:diaminopimelate decarboxylase [uncultured Limosilactobacillus sp.]|uniref:diaminopimelate decarboxylase n=1 Tax=uncultured Limosilactobacillus sp. TaxID=2837629 RepID=UPI0025F9DA2C|nr:diaminopimelate decarboxylase [uncultured Limosilactobacillus sp.]